MKLVSSLILIVLALAPNQLVSDAKLAEIAGTALRPTEQPVTAEYRPVAIPVKTGAEPAPQSATAVYAVDVATGQPLTAYDAERQLPIASITKLATALVIARKYEPQAIITIPKLPAYPPEEVTIGLKEGEKFTAKDLTAALLIHSANDAADALAISISGSREGFSAEMNRVIADWGIKNARFNNPSGITDVGNGASAKALSQLGLLALRNQTVKQLVGTQTATINSEEGRQVSLQTTDQLLQTGRYQGIKTGYTPAAGQCFIGLTTIQGRQVITVILGSQDRFGDTERLVAWINRNYKWQLP